VWKLLPIAFRVSRPGVLAVAVPGTALAATIAFDDGDSSYKSEPKGASGPTLGL
jgi:hypothetical protein